MANKERYISIVCSLNRPEELCIHKPCDGCGWSYAEIERRRKLPLVELPNGLYGKRVGKNCERVGESREK